MTDQHEVVDEEEYQHVRIHNRVIEDYMALIGVHAYAVYSVLKLRANNSTKRCFPGLKHIETKTGLSRPTVIKAIRTLEEYGLVEVEHRHSASGDASSNAYHLKTPPQETLKRDLGGSKGDLPADKGVVNAADYLVNGVDEGSKGDLLPVVNAVDSNNTILYPTSLNQTQQQPAAPEAKPQAEPEDVAFAAALTQDLIAQGVTPKVAQSLVKTYPEAVIRQQLAWLPQRKYADAAATLVESIKEGYDTPAAAKKSVPRPKSRLVVRDTPLPPLAPSEESVQAMRAALGRLRGRTGNQTPCT